MILEAPPASGKGKRVCPKCGRETAGKFCNDCKVRSIYETSALKKYGDLRVEDGLPFFGGFFENSVYGYDLRFLTTKIKDLASEASRYYRAYVETQKPKTAVFSHDQRQSGGLLKDAFAKAMKESGPEFVEVEGFMSTTSAPFFGAMVAREFGHRILLFHATASHNPPDYNGFKVFHGDFSHRIFPSEVEIRERVFSDEIHKAYSDFLVKRFGGRGPSGLRFDFDAMHGIGWEILKDALPKVAPGARPFRKEPLADLGGLKLAQPPDFHEGHKGLSFCADGDADRIVMYYNGKYTPMSKFYAILAEHGLFKEHLLVDQRVSAQTVGFLEERGVRVSRGKIGRTFQEDMGAELGALWMEENWHSGGYRVDGVRLFWPEASLGLMDWLNALETVGVDKFFATKVPDPILRSAKLHGPANMNEVFWAEAPRTFKDAEVTRIDPDDGVRVEFRDGHMLLRESNTECGKIRVEANGKDAETAEGILKMGVGFVEEMKRKHQ